MTDQATFNADLASLVARLAGAVGDIAVSKQAAAIEREWRKKAKTEDAYMVYLEMIDLLHGVLLQAVAEKRDE